MMIRWILALAAALFAATAWAEEPNDAQQAPLAAYYGFLSPEIYKLDFRTQNLLVRDLNGDKRPDVLVVNNLRNRIDVLQQRKPGEKPSPPAFRDVNALDLEQRLEHRKISAPRVIASLDVADVNNDGRLDLVYLGAPAGLYIEYQSEAGGFTEQREFDVDDAQQGSWMLSVGDLNGDGLNDIAFLGRQNLYIAYQAEGGRMREPTRQRHTASGPSLIRVLDFNEDGRNDVVYLSQDDKFPVLARFQNEEGRLGPERRFSIDPSTAISYANVDGKPGKEVLSISGLSNRLLVYRLSESQNGGDEPTSQMLVFPFEKSGTGTRADLTVADFDGDKRIDVLVPDPDGARLLLYRQSEQGLDVATPYPAMLGTSVVRALDLDGDGKAEVLSLSDQENSIGMSRFENSRLTYPQVLPTSDEPVVMETLHEGKRTRLVYLARGQDPKTRRDKFTLRALEPKEKEGQWTWSRAKLGDADSLDIKLTGKPYDLKAVDANGDGRPDLMFFFLFQPPVLWLADGEGSFREPDKANQGTLGDISPAAVYFGKLAGTEPELLIAQNNFARNMRIGTDGRWKVRDQYNSGSASAKVVGIAAIDLTGDGKPELAMFDRASESILFLKEQEGLYRRWGQLKVASFDLRGVRVADFDHDGRDDLLLFDGDKMGIAFTGKTDIELRQIASYETDIRNGKLLDMVAGDLNADGRLDILLIETARKHLEIVAVGPDTKLTKVLHWKVYEEKTFRRRFPGIDPREAAIADVNSDGRNDIILLVHDRVLVYLQDAGEEAGARVAERAKEKPKGDKSP